MNQVKSNQVDSQDGAWGAATIVRRGPFSTSYYCRMGN